MTNLEYEKMDFYHGSGEDFDEFSQKLIGSNFKSSKAFYFTNNTSFEKVITGSGVKLYEDGYSAGAYAKNNIDGHPVIYICNLILSNPMTIDYIVDVFYLNKEDPFVGNHPQDFLDENIDNLLNICKEKGFDSIILDQKYYSEENEITIVVLDAKQIKFKFLQNKNQIELFLNKKSMLLTNNSKRNKRIIS